MSYYKPKLVEPKLIKYYINKFKEQCAGEIIKEDIIIKEDNSIKNKILNYIYDIIINYYSLIILIIIIIILLYIRYNEDLKLKKNKQLYNDI